MGLGEGQAARSHIRSVTSVLVVVAQGPAQKMEVRRFQEAGKRNFRGPRRDGDIVQGLKIAWTS